MPPVPRLYQSITAAFLYHVSKTHQERQTTRSAIESLFVRWRNLNTDHDCFEYIK